MERRVYVDYLKVLACITIVALHVIGQGTVFGTNETVDIYLMCIQLLTRWAVPAFVMASGCNLLGRENGFAVAKKHILKMLRLVLVWGLIYVAEDPFLDIIRGKTVSMESFVFSEMFQDKGYHIWFCFMIIGLYGLIPILNPVIKDKRHCEYLIGVLLVGSILLPIVEAVGERVQVVETIISHLHFPNFGYYLYYFVLGYYIDRYADCNKRARCILYTAGALSLGLLIANQYASMVGSREALLTGAWYELFLLIFVVGVYTYFRFDFKPGKGYPLVKSILKESFGIYMMHWFWYIRLSGIGMHSAAWNPVLAVPMVTALVVLICFVSCKVVRKIPVLNQWLL